jgi:hypothetical protein
MKPSILFLLALFPLIHTYAQNCQCEDSKLSLKFEPKPGKQLLVCGKKDSTINDRHRIITDVNAIDCTTGETFLGETEGEKFDVKQKADMVQITSLRYLPVGKHFAWQTTPYLEQDIQMVKDSFAISANEWKLELAPLSKEEIKAVQKDLKEHAKDYAKMGNAYDNKKLIGKLLVCALHGDKESETLFENLQEKLGKTYEGDLADAYEDAQNILDFYRESHHLDSDEGDDD